MNDDSNVSPNADCIFMPSVLPLEIEETILDFLAEDDEGHSALKTCSLVCQAFLPICRKHIFKSIILNDADIPSPSIHAFDLLLRETPKIADYIREFDYNILIADSDSPCSPSIQESLKRISRLEFLTVQQYGGPKFDWSNNPIRPALLHLLHLPTVTHFQASRLNNFIVSDLIPCVNLKYLDIGLHMTVATKNTFPAALPGHSIRLNEFVAGIGTSAVIMELCTARRSDGQPIVDFGSLSKIEVELDLEEPDDGKASQELFRRCHVLTNAHIYFWGIRNVRPSLADLVRPSMQTLKHIAVNVEVYDHDFDPLFDIPSDLEEIRSKNIIETVTIGVHTDADCRKGDDWGRLDEVLTAPGWFSLKRVSLTIECASCGRGDEDDELRNLPETQFPRLSSSTSVSFEFKALV